jgi:alkylation response protein AidB-like acyl-CoA dehydrogenase
VLSADGKSWKLTGSKLYITNAGFADIFTIFAKVDGEKFTAFLVDRSAPGLTVGPEEHKLGIRGSSTCPLYLEDCTIPVENVLGEIGKGHKIAFNILNIGRFKLGACVTGGAKLAIGETIGYAKNRMAFGHPISDFGLIRHKLGQMSILAYVSESVVYRTAGMIDRNLQGVDIKATEACLQRIEEYDVECSMVKVWCSEMLDYVVDEGVQIYASAGYVEDYPAERHWRDARINRIFEGTNEINRLLVPGRLLRRALRGELAIFASAMTLMEEVTGGRPAAETPAGFLSAEARMTTGAKKIALMCLGLAAQKFGERLADEQEVLGLFADMAMETYALESALLRAQKRAARFGAAEARLHEAAVRCFAQEALDRVDASARQLLAALYDGDALTPYLAAVEKFSKRETPNTVGLRRQVAAAAIELGKYPF